MNERSWDFDATPSTAPPVRPRPLAPVGGYVTGLSGDAPPAPPQPTDPFGLPPRSATTPMTVAAPTPRGPRWGWRALVAFIAGGAMTAAGFGVGYRADNQVEAGSSTTGATVTASAGNPIVVTPPVIDTTEPAAFVASILGPSIVQINTNRGLGSGIIFEDGLILTNNHVIDQAATVSVRLADGRALDATVVGSDPRTDIAVVSVGSGHNLQPATLALDVPVEVGEYAVAIGSPFDLQQTVTSGIVSAVNRPIYNGTGWNAMVQTDAAINPGNSGGALADREGRVIGINTAIQTDGVSSTNAGIGFAMPITTAHDIAMRIIDGQPLDPGFLGVTAGPVGVDELGVSVTEVTPGSAAEQAGIQVGDRVLSLDGAPVSAFEQLAGLIQTSFPGDQVVMHIVRNGQEMDITVTLGSR